MSTLSKIFSNLVLKTSAALGSDPSATIRNGSVKLGNRQKTTGGRPQRQYGLQTLTSGCSYCQINPSGTGQGPVNTRH